MQQLTTLRTSSLRTLAHNMATIYSNFQQGTLSASLTNTATVLNSTNFVSLPTVASPDTMWLVLDPNSSGGTPEVVQVTIHTAAATTVTVTRGQQSSTARSHAAGIAWVACVTTSDLNELPFRKMTTKGDLLFGIGSNQVSRLGVGTNGFALVADSAQTTGTKWADVSGLPYVCTSTTRPSSPTNGMMIYETDTYNTLVYYSSASVWRLPWNMPWGYINSSKVTTAITSNAADLTTVVFTAVANRRYRVTGQVYAVSSTVSNDIYYLTLADNAVANFAQQTNTCDQANNGAPGDTIIGLITETSAGSKTYYLKGGRVAGSGNISFNAAATAPIMLLVEDIGPSGAPA